MANPLAAAAAAQLVHGNQAAAQVSDKILFF
jgi:hypothetical protein